MPEFLPVWNRSCPGDAATTWCPRRRDNRGERRGRRTVAALAAAVSSLWVGGLQDPSPEIVAVLVVTCSTATASERQQRDTEVSEASEVSEDLLCSLPSQDPLPPAGREGIDVEIEEQAYVQVRKSEVRQDLRDVHRGETSYVCSSIPGPRYRWTSVAPPMIWPVIPSVSSFRKPVRTPRPPTSLGPPCHGVGRMRSPRGRRMAGSAEPHRVAGQGSLRLT
jgi:hypothetical protein